MVIVNQRYQIIGKHGKTTFFERIHIVTSCSFYLIAISSDKLCNILVLNFHY